MGEPILTTGSDVESEKRGSRRIKVFLPTEIEIDDTALRAHVLDLSVSGARLHTKGSLQSGSDAKLRLDDKVWPAKVAWVDGGRSGIEFRVQLTLQQVAELIEAEEQRSVVSAARPGTRASRAD